MTADTGLMREAASQVKKEEAKYMISIENIDNLITNVLAQYWVDEDYDDLKAKYTSKSRADLNELGETIKDFSEKLYAAADEFDETINGLRH